MVIIETPIFTRIITEVMNDDEYRELQEALVIRPNCGDLIKKSGGLRKVRWKLQDEVKVVVSESYITGWSPINKFTCCTLMRKVGKKT